MSDIVKQAKAIPGQLNGILRLHFCIWTDAESAWMTRSTLEPRIADFDIEENYGEQISNDPDLSRNRDITAMAALVQTGQIDVEIQGEGTTETVLKPTLDAWIEACTPRDTIQARPLQDKLPYSV